MTPDLNKQTHQRRACAGLLQRREVWAPTWQGWLLLALLICAAFAGFLFGAYPFLAPTHRVPSNLLVVEGWMPHYSIGQVAQEFLSRPYHRAVIVCPIVNLDDKFESGQDEGETLKLLLEKHGVPRSEVTVLYPFVAKRDRTFHSALAVKNWLAEQHLAPQGLDVITLGPHARRTWLLYQKAFGPDTAVGIVAVQDMLFDPSRWWRYSEGVRSVTDEALAYLYAKIVF